MVIDEGQVLRYVASTDKAGRLLEAAQEKAGVGPCVEALVLNRTVATRDIQADCRWPDVSAALDGSLVRAGRGPHVVFVTGYPFFGYGWPAVLAISAAGLPPAVRTARGCRRR